VHSIFHNHPALQQQPSCRGICCSHKLRRTGAQITMRIAQRSSTIAGRSLQRTRAAYGVCVHCGAVLLLVDTPTARLSPVLCYSVDITTTDRQTDRHTDSRLPCCCCYSTASDIAISAVFLRSPQQKLGCFGETLRLTAYVCCD